MSFRSVTATHPTLTKLEQAALLVTTSKTKGAEREHMIYSLALATALRESEIVALNMGDVYLEGDVRSKIMLTVFKGSQRELAAGPPGKKTPRRRVRQVVYLPRGLRLKLAYYLKWKKKAGESLRGEAPLFCVSKVGFGSELGDRLSTRSLRFHFRRWQERLRSASPPRFEELHGFHVLRHTAISNIYRVTKDLRHAQTVARHANVNTTEIYTHLTEDEIRRAIEGLPC